MCRNFTITYMLCLHTRIDHQPCIKFRSFFSLFASTCKNDASEINVNDFCLECRKFWDEELISETARRELAQSFRLINAYHGELTPVKNEIGAISFRGEGELGEQVNDEARLPSGFAIDNDDVTTVCMLNARFHWLAAGDEPFEQPEPDLSAERGPRKQSEPKQEQDLASLPPLPQSPTSRRDSDASMLTIWPAGSDGTPFFNTDEFGKDVEVQDLIAPPAAHLPGLGYSHLAEPEKKKFDE